MAAAIRGAADEEEEAEEAEVSVPLAAKEEERAALVGDEVGDSQEDKDNKIPAVAMAGLGFILFANAFNVTVLFPFLPFMVRSFGDGAADAADSDADAEDDPTVGMHAGFIASSFMLGRFFSSFGWGVVADRYGRKYVFWCGLVSMVICAVGFGMSRSLAEAMLWRFAAGLGNGVVAVAKAVASELCGAKAQAKAMTLVSGTWGLGIAIGPALGGLTSETGGGVLAANPFLLPMLLTAGLGVIGLPVLHHCVPETRRARADATAVVADANGTETAAPRRSGKYAKLEEDDEEEEALELVVVSEAVPAAAEEATPEEEAEQTEPDDGRSLFRRPVVRMMIAVYCVISLLSIAFDELFSVWASTQRSQGGLGFDSRRVGVALMCIAVGVTTLNVTFFARIVRRFGELVTFRSMILVMVPLTFAFPHLNLLLDSPALWPVLVAGSIVRMTSNAVCFTASFILLNNSVPRSLRGRTNGAAMGMASLFKAAGPTIGGSMFTWSLKSKHPYPFDYHLVYYLIAVCLAALFAVSAAVPSSLNKPVAEKEEA